MTQLLGKAPEVPDYPRLMEAQSQVDSNYANRFRRLRAGRNELASLLLVLLLALAALVSVFLLGNKVDLTRVTFTNSKLLMVVLLFGVIGATLSAMQRSSRRAPMLVPDARAAAIASVIRSVSGAGGGLVALAAAQAGLLGSEPGTVFLGAFAAGFSERFILRFLPGGEEGEDHEPTNPGGEDLTSSDDS